MTTSQITTHVLNTTSGLPAVGVFVVLEGPDSADARLWVQLASAVTDQEGRVKSLGPEILESGSYRLRFNTGAYFAALSIDTFFPEVVLTFSAVDQHQHYHVPLLLSPFAFSTYRGS